MFLPLADDVKIPSSLYKGPVSLSLTTLLCGQRTFGTLNVTSDSSAYLKAELWIFFHYFFFSLVAGRVMEVLNIIFILNLNGSSWELF